MAVTQDRPAPYAPASAILSLVDKYRNRGLPSPIDGAVLERAGVSPSLVPRTLQALQALDLIADDGRPTEVLEGLRLAPEGEYNKRLTDWLTDAYADALAFIDPATATETQIRDAFRKYIPVGQQDRMVSLFTGLFTAAGVMPERQRQATPRKPIGNSTPKPRAGAKSLIGEAASRRDTRGGGGGSGGGGGGFKAPSDMPPAIAGLVQSLPKPDEGWTQAERDKFIKTFEAVLDFVFPIVEPTKRQLLDLDDDENGG